LSCMTILLDLLFPPACGGCGATGSGLCRRCTPAFAEAEHFSLGPLIVHSAARYDGPLRRAMLCFKRGRRDVGERFAELLAERCAVHVSGAALIWIPATAAGRRERGFDQAELLARGVAKLSGGEALPLLRRARDERQRGRSRAGRIAAAGRFSCPETAVVPSRVVLVDDVITTGATLCDAAEALRSAGIVAAGAIVVARAV